MANHLSVAGMRACGSERTQSGSAKVQFRDNAGFVPTAVNSEYGKRDIISVFYVLFEIATDNAYPISGCTMSEWFLMNLSAFRL